MIGVTRIFRKSALPIAGAILFTVIPTWSDTLTLRNGKSVPGHLLGVDGTSVTFKDCDGGTRTYSVADVDTIRFSGGDEGENRGGSNRRGDRSRYDAACSDQGSSEQIALTAGTEISVRTIDRIDSKDAKEGQFFAAEIAEDVRGADGAVAIPRGSDASLVMRRLDQNGELTLDVDSISVGGRRMRVSTTDQEAGNRADGVGANKRTGKFVGGGAALGAIVGAIAGGGKGAAIGAVAGAGAGAGAQIITRGKEVHVPPETVLRFQLDRPLRLES